VEGDQAATAVSLESSLAGRKPDTLVGVPRGALFQATQVIVKRPDWFHLGMRLQHLAQVAGGLSSDSPERAAAKAAVVEEVDRLHWRLWNGKAKDAGISLDRIRAVMHHFRGEPDGRRSVAPSRKLWTALRALNDHLTGQSDWLVNYAERHRAGQRVGTALTAGTANFLVNRRMAKAQQMRWTRRGPAAPGPLRRLQRHARHRLRAALPRQRLAPGRPHAGNAPRRRGRCGGLSEDRSELLADWWT